MKNKYSIQIQVIQILEKWIFPLHFHLLCFTPHLKSHPFHPLPFFVIILRSSSFDHKFLCILFKKKKKKH